MIAHPGGCGGMVAKGGNASCTLTTGSLANSKLKADVIYHGGPILILVKDGDWA